jgi:hypothetical protein
MRYWVRWAGAEAAADAFVEREVMHHNFVPPDPPYEAGDVLFLVVGEPRPSAPKRLIGWQVVESVEPGKQICRVACKFHHRFTPEDMRTTPHWRTLSLPIPDESGGQAKNGRELQGSALHSVAQLIYRKGERVPEELLSVARAGDDALAAIPEGPYVFFAWQQDRPAREHRTFIRDALDAALAQRELVDAVQEPPRGMLAPLLSGAENVPGMPDIPSIILARIRECSVFVADLTFTSETAAGKKVPNGNVLFELGCAVTRQTDGWNSVLCIINTHSGAWDEMLFDLRHRRKAVEYHLPPDATPEVRKREQQRLTATLADIFRTHYANLLHR